MNSSPDHGIGRPMKVGKEEAVGLVTALELFANENFERSEVEAWTQRTNYVVSKLSEVRGVSAYSGFSPMSSTGRAVHPDGVPIAHVSWDNKIVSLSTAEVVSTLRNTQPHIVVGQSLEGLMVCPHTVEPGEERIIVDRLIEVLSASS